MNDLKQAAIELKHEKIFLEIKIRKLIEEFQNKTGFEVQEVVITEILNYGDKAVREYYVKLAL